MSTPNDENDPQQAGEGSEGYQQPVDPAQYPQEQVDPAQYQQPADPAQYPQEQVNPAQYQPPAPAEEANYEAYQELAPPPPAVNQPQQPSEAIPPPPAITGQPARRRTPATGRRSAPRTKTASRGRAPAGRPGYRGKPARGRAPSPGSGGGFMTVLLALIAVGFLGAVVMVMMPKDLSHIKGFPATKLDTDAPRNLLMESQAIMFDPNKSVEFSEEEVNRYLNHRISGNQEGALGSLMKYEGAYIDFDESVAEIYVLRSVFGMPVTMSSRIRIERFRSEVKWVAAGGTLGKINLSSSHLQPVIEVYLRMMKSFKDEVAVIQHMANIRFEEDKVVFESTL